MAMPADRRHRNFCRWEEYAPFRGWALPRGRRNISSLESVQDVLHFLVTASSRGTARGRQSEHRNHRRDWAAPSVAGWLDRRLESGVLRARRTDRRQAGRVRSHPHGCDRAAGDVRVPDRSGRPVRRADAETEVERRPRRVWRPGTDRWADASASATCPPSAASRQYVEAVANLGHSQLAQIAVEVLDEMGHLVAAHFRQRYRNSFRRQLVVPVVLVIAVITGQHRRRSRSARSCAC